MQNNNKKGMARQKQPHRAHFNNKKTLGNLVAPGVKFVNRLRQQQTTRAHKRKI